jgi:uncharacterized flavoprotein (TIGR03862 family)
MSAPREQRVIVIGAGPAGLMAAEHLAQQGFAVAVHERMPSVGRKFLMAGRGGLNLTHAEPLPDFLARYRPNAPVLRAAIAAFPPSQLIDWCHGLGIETFIGSSQRVFPRALKASPLLRAWMQRLEALGVTLHTRHRWIGLDAAGQPRFETPAGMVTPRADAVVLALGGASWPRLGSDGGWVGLLGDVPITPFMPANMGFRLSWSALFRDRFAGQPLKRIALSHAGEARRGEAMVTATGLEGGVLYALSAPLREAIAQHGHADITLDLKPDLDLAEVTQRLAQRGRAETISTALRKALAMPPVAIALVQEVLHAKTATRPLPELVKALPLRLDAAEGLARAISSAGGIAWPALDEHLMLRAHPGVFACGEMLDWEAPTGGYLLQGCFSTGLRAAQGAAAWLQRST